MYVCRLFLALIIAHAVAEETEVWPLSSTDELLQLSDIVENDPDQQRLAKTAENAQSTAALMAMTEKTSKTDSDTKDSESKGATKRAVATTSLFIQQAAATAKNEASFAKSKHDKAYDDLSTAETVAAEAMKGARDTKATVNPQLTAGEKIEQERRTQRLQQQEKSLETRLQEAQAENEVSKSALIKGTDEYDDVVNKLAKDKSIKADAMKQQKALEREGSVIHRNAHDAMHMLRKAKDNEKKASSAVRSAKVMEIVASAEADSSGGDDVDLERSSEKRAEVDQHLKLSTIQVSTLKLALEKAKGLVNAATATWQAKEDAVDENVRMLRKADGRFAEAKYDIDQAQHAMVIATENESQVKAEQDVSAKELITASALTDAVRLQLSNSENADEASMKALLGAPQEAEKEAQNIAQDKDGFSNKGEQLISKDGAISEAYIKQFDEMPMQDNGVNHILEAEVRAQLKDDPDDEASAVAASSP